MHWRSAPALTLTCRSPAELAHDLADADLVLHVDAVELAAVANERPVEEVAVEANEDVWLLFLAGRGQDIDYLDQVVETFQKRFFGGLVVNVERTLVVGVGCVSSD